MPEIRFRIRYPVRVVAPFARVLYTADRQIQQQQQQQLSCVGSSGRRSCQKLLTAVHARRSKETGKQPALFFQGANQSQPTFFAELLVPVDTGQAGYSVKLVVGREQRVDGSCLHSNMSTSCNVYQNPGALYSYATTPWYCC